MRWWTRLFQARRLERQLDAELRDHLDRHVRDLMDAGLDEAEARRQARLALGGLDQVKEACRDVRGTRWLDEIVQDLRYGARLLLANRSFTLIAVLSLALGIGANTAIFSIIDSLMLRSLPVHQPERLAVLARGSWTHPIWVELRDRQTTLFESAATWSDDRFDLSPGGTASYVEGIWTSANFFDVIGVRPILGRTFTPADDTRGGGPDGPVAIISHAFWQRHFAGAADVIGRTLTLNRVPFTVVGVTPPGFSGLTVGRAFDVAVPLGAEPVVRGRDSLLDGHSTWWLEIVVRLKPGQTIEQATAALRAVQPAVRQATMPPDWPPQMQERYLDGAFTLEQAANGRSELRLRYQRPLFALLVVVALVLLIACADIANLLLAQGNARRHEFGMRLALGASRWRLARQLLAESLLLAAIGTLLGLGFAYWGSHLIVSQISTPDEPVFLDLGVSARTLLFTAAVTIATALLFGIVPAFRAGRAEPAEATRDQARTIAGARGSHGGPLVVVQVALCLVLVVAAGLFLRTFTALASRDLGLDRDPLLVVNVDAQRLQLETPARRALFERALEAAARTPGVQHAAMSVLTPVSGMGWNGGFEFPDGPELPERERIAFINAVTPGWFATYGTAFRAGRDFDHRDREGAPPVAIVNETFVNKFMKGKAPLGRTFVYPRRDNRTVLQIVGVVEDAVYRNAREPVPPTVYLPFAQTTDGIPPFSRITVRAAGVPPASLARPVAQAIGRVSPDLALMFQPMTQVIGGALAQERLIAMLSGFFGALALLLAGMGLYAVTSYGVTRRRAEIGVRIALGARTADVVRLVAGRAGLHVAIGVAIGATIAAWAAQFVASLLYGLEARDPLTIGGAAVVLMTTGAVAAWLPARRAARIDPARVLRES
ncbi:MAG TPA: ABC transporter permease [Vicinamibacterales bacterium]